MYEREPGTWLLRVYAGRENGRNVYASKTVQGSKKLAKEALEKFSVEVKERRATLPGAGTVAQLLDDWWTSHFWKAARSRRQAREDIQRYLNPQLGHILLVRLDHKPIDELYRGLLNGRLSKSGRPLAPGTVARLHVTLNAALEWGVLKGRLGRNPAARADAPKDPPTSAVVPEREEVERLIQAAEKMAMTSKAYEPAPFRFFLEMAAGTGRRRGDLLGLQAGDFEGESVTFQRRLTFGDDGPIIEPGDKNGRRVRLAIDPFLAELAELYLKQRAEEARILGTAWTRRSFVFSDDGGRTPWRPDSTTRKFRYLARKVGLEHLDLHYLRHYHATELLSVGVSIEAVAYRLGDDYRTVFKTYSHFRPPIDLETARVWGRLREEAHG